MVWLAQLSSQQRKWSNHKVEFQLPAASLPEFVEGSSLQRHYKMKKATIFVAFLFAV